MTDKSDIAVFISYGRADASVFVDRLAADLDRAGLKIWRDVAQLRSPHPWDDQIQAALKQSDVVVAVLTPHAVRAVRQPGKADESVCLDELAFARFSPPATPIVPILLRPCEPPFVIYRTQYLDFLGSRPRTGALRQGTRRPRSHNRIGQKWRAAIVSDHAIRAAGFRPLLESENARLRGPRVADG